MENNETGNNPNLNSTPSDTSVNSSPTPSVNPAPTNVEANANPSPSISKPQEVMEEKKPEGPKKGNKKTIAIVACSVATVGLLVGMFFAGRAAKGGNTPIAETTFQVVLNPGEGKFDGHFPFIILNNVKKDTILSEARGYLTPYDDLYDFSHWTSKDGTIYGLNTPIISDVVLTAHYTTGTNYTRKTALKEVDQIYYEVVAVMNERGLDVDHSNIATILSIFKDQIGDFTVFTSPKSIEIVRDFTIHALNSHLNDDINLDFRNGGGIFSCYLISIDRITRGLTDEQIIDYMEAVDAYFDIAISSEARVSSYFDIMFDEIFAAMHAKDARSRLINKKLSYGALKAAAHSNEKTYPILSELVHKLMDSIYNDSAISDEAAGEISEIASSYIGALSAVQTEEASVALEKYYQDSKEMYINNLTNPDPLTTMKLEIRKAGFDSMCKMEYIYDMSCALDNLKAIEDAFVDSYNNIKADQNKVSTYLEIATKYASALRKQGDFEEEDNLVSVIKSVYEKMLDNNEYNLIKDDVLYAIGVANELPAVNTNGFKADATFKTLGVVLTHVVDVLEKENPENEMGNQFIEIVNRAMLDSIKFSNAASLVVTNESLHDLNAYYMKEMGIFNSDDVIELDEGDAHALAGLFLGFSRAFMAVADIDGQSKLPNLCNFFDSKQIASSVQNYMDLNGQGHLPYEAVYKTPIGKAYERSLLSLGVVEHISWFVCEEETTFKEQLDRIIQLPDLTVGKTFDESMDLITATTDYYLCEKIFTYWHDPEHNDFDNYRDQKSYVDEFKKSGFSFEMYEGTRRFDASREIYYRCFIDKLFKNMPADKWKQYRDNTVTEWQKILGPVFNY